MARILYIWKGDYPWEVRIEKFCRALLESNHEVIILCRWSEGRPREEIIDGVRIIRIGHGKPFSHSTPVSPNPYWYKSIKENIINFRPELVIVREIMLAEAAGRLARNYDVPVIMDMAEHYPAVMRGWKKYYDRIIYRFLVHYMKVPEMFERRSVGLMDGIIAVCSENAERLVKQYGFPVHKMAIVQNTPDLKQFSEVKKGCNQPPIVFAYHGNVNSERNMVRFVRGFIIAANKDPEIKLEIAGIGEDTSQIIEMVNSSDVSSSFRMYGEFSHSDLTELYSRADIGVLPYKLDDHIHNTISNKFFDYLACGKPVLASPAAPMVRLIKETEAGVIADCDDENSIAEAILNFKNQDVEKLSENGMVAASEKYNWDVDKKTFLEFVEKYL